MAKLAAAELRCPSIDAAGGSELGLRRAQRYSRPGRRLLRERSPTDFAPRLHQPRKREPAGSPPFRAGQLSPASVLDLQRLAGNQATVAAIAGGSLIQRQNVMDATRWHKASEAKWGSTPYKRSPLFQAIETAIRGYDAVRTGAGDAQVRALRTVIDAIAAWKASKKDATKSKRAAAVATLVAQVETEYVGRLYQVLDQRAATERDAWDPSHFSDPTKHDPQDFTYIINAVAEYPTGDPDYITKTLADPSRISQALLSTSIITQDVQGFFSPSGFILKVPKGNVVSAKAGDAGVQNKEAFAGDVRRAAEVWRIYEQNGIPTPDAVLKQQAAAQQKLGPFQQPVYNEVNVLGESASSGEKAEVSAIFVVVEKAGDTEPITLWRPKQVSGQNQIKDGKTVVEPVKAVSDARLKMYEALKKPIVYIPYKPGSRLTAFAGTAQPFDENRNVKDSASASSAV
jgi:hypothetical protein